MEVSQLQERAAQLKQAHLRAREQRRAQKDLLARKVGTCLEQSPELAASDLRREKCCFVPIDSITRSSLVLSVHEEV